VDRTTASAAELTAAELRNGRDALADKIALYRPATVAILGITAYRTGFGRPKATLGPQDEALAGSPIWVLPNPSGLNAHHQIDDLIYRFGALRAATGVR
jgi:TDG/mug DNA glycosylase family protein